jgi:hypothetical protein
MWEKPSEKYFDPFMCSLPTLQSTGKGSWCSIRINKTTKLRMTRTGYYVTDFLTTCTCSAQLLLKMLFPVANVIVIAVLSELLLVHPDWDVVTPFFLQLFLFPCIDVWVPCMLLFRFEVWPIRFPTLLYFSALFYLILARPVSSAFSV